MDDAKGYKWGKEKPKKTEKKKTKKKEGEDPNTPKDKPIRGSNRWEIAGDPNEQAMYAATIRRRG